MTNSGKHAYLIIAHSNFLILEKLIRLLDDERNDIYIHIDKKASEWDISKYVGILKKSNVLFIKREKIRWGGFSQINCELELLKAAAVKHYDYYHLLSGVDLPLKSQDYIHDFFQAHAGKEFIHFDSCEYDERNNSRVKYYHFLKGVRLKPDFFLTRAPVRITGYLLILLQAMLRINRIKGLELQLQKGANWFSITDSLATYIISQEELIRKLFRYSSCGDEMFLQTLVWNSRFRDRLYYKNGDNSYKAIMRYIDWSRGKPYVWRLKDYRELMESEYLFARKFDTNTDFHVVERIYQNLKSISAVASKAVSQERYGRPV